VHDSAAARKMARAVESLCPPSRWEELRNLTLQAAKAAVFQRPLYGVFGRPMRRWAEKWALLEPRLDLNAIQRSYAAAACRQALRLPERVERQRVNSLRLLARLARAEDVVLPRERAGARYNYHIFPVLLRNREERDAVRAHMWSRFVDTSTIYSQAIEECRRYGYRGGCPVAESVSERLITLPNHAALTDRDVDVVAEVFLAGLQACRRAQAAYFAPASETAGDL